MQDQIVASHSFVTCVNWCT